MPASDLDPILEASAAGKMKRMVMSVRRSPCVGNVACLDLPAEMSFWRIERINHELMRFVRAKK